MENLFEQMTNITKAHGYDILSKQVGELKSENSALEAQVKELKEGLKKLADTFERVSECENTSIGDYEIEKARELLNK